MNIKRKLKNLVTEDRFNVILLILLYHLNLCWGHGGKMVTLSPPTSEAGVRSLTRPQVGKLVVACHWSALYSTEP